MIKFIVHDYDEQIQWSFDEEELYWQYKNELWAISKEHGYSRYVVNEWYKDILESQIYIIRILNKYSKQVGFVFIGVEDACHPDADYYIQDCYLVPEYRRQRVMETIIQSFFKKHPGKYCFFLIDDNLPAKAFWSKQFFTIGYTECPIIDYDDMETFYCHIHAYSKTGL